MDSSREMLALAQAKLENESFPRTFLLGDFTQPNFRETCDELLTNFETRIYAIIGGTFGNFDQAGIAAKLSDLLSTGDYIYLDLVPKPETAAELAQLEQRFLQLKVNYQRFFSSVLTRLCMPEDAGEIVSETTSDPGLDTLRCTFSFCAREMVHFHCFGETVPLYPGETIDLLTIRAYEPAKLRQFMAARGFRYVDQYLPDVGNLSHRWLRQLFIRL